MGGKAVLSAVACFNHRRTVHQLRNPAPYDYNRARATQTAGNYTILSIRVHGMKGRHTPFPRAKGGRPSRVQLTDFF